MSSSQKLLLLMEDTSLKARRVGGGTSTFVIESERLAANSRWLVPPPAAGWTSTARTLVPETRAELGKRYGPRKAGFGTLVRASVEAVIGPAGRFHRRTSVPLR